MPAGRLYIIDYTCPNAGAAPQDRRFCGTPQRLISVGPAGVATVSGGFASQIGAGRVFIFPLSAFTPIAPTVLPPANSRATGLRRFAIPANGMAAAPGGERLYMSLQAAPPIGNSIVSFDVVAGTFGNPVWVGSDPGALVRSSDGRYLHAVINGSRTLARLRLPDLTIEKQSPIIDNESHVLFDANWMLSLPSNPKSVVVGRVNWYDGYSSGVAIYDDDIGGHRSRAGMLYLTTPPRPA